MLRFYGKLLRRTPTLLWESAKKWDAVAGVATLCLLGLGVTIEEVPWWVVFAPIGLLFLYGMLKSNYEEFRGLERRIGELEAELAGATQQRDEANKQLHKARATVAELEDESMTLAVQTAKIKAHFARQLLPIVEIPAQAAQTRHLKNTAFQIALFVSDGSTINGWTFEDCVVYGPAILDSTHGTYVEKPSWGTSDLEYFLKVVEEPAYLGTGVIRLKNCTFRRCLFVHTKLFATPEQVERIKMEAEQGLDKSSSEERE